MTAMNWSWVGVLAMSLLVGAVARPAESAPCREDEKDEEGRCPKKMPPPRPSLPPPPQVATQLSIQGPDLAGAQISLDRQPAGRGPQVKLTTPGRHLVEVTRVGYQPYAAWVEVKKGERKVVEVNLKLASTTPVPQPMAVKTENCPEGMVRVAGGMFQMGSPDGTGNDSEHPQHAVTLSGYCIDTTEVTVNAYGACVAARGCSAASLTAQFSTRATYEEDLKFWSRHCNRSDRPDHPMNCVDWDQAAAFCKWAGKRLPTEAEWEYAARGNDGRVYPWGNEAPSAKRLNACGRECVAMKKDLSDNQWSAMYIANDGWETTAPVGSFPDGKSPFGALDMAGNVAEWTADRFHWYSNAAATNPLGNTGIDRVARGGGWSKEYAVHVRAAYRDLWGSQARSSTVGFRCARGD